MAPIRPAISPPLEAGPSLHDYHSLPPYLPAALEYMSQRLAARALHVTLVAVRRDYQLPANVLSASSSSSPVTSHPITPNSPTTTTSRVAALKLGFSRAAADSPLFMRRRRSARKSWSVGQSPRSPANPLHPVMPESPRSPTTPMSSPYTPPIDERRRLWQSPLAMHPVPAPRTSPVLPARSSSFHPSSPKSLSSFSVSSASSSTPVTPKTPRTPMTPSSPFSFSSSSVCDPWSSPVFTPGPFGVRLMYDPLPDNKAEGFLHELARKAERKFQAGAEWLSRAMFPSPTSLGPLLMRDSIRQNDVIFSSEGLTLLALDRLYTFKSALTAYSRGHASAGLEDVVDELHRLIVARGGRKLSQSDIHRSYDWLGASKAALADVELQYRQTYGGMDKIGPFAGGGFLDGVILGETQRSRRKADGVVAAQLWDHVARPTVTTTKDSRDYSTPKTRGPRRLGSITEVEGESGLMQFTGPRGGDETPRRASASPITGTTATTTTTTTTTTSTAALSGPRNTPMLRLLTFFQPRSPRLSSPRVSSWDGSKRGGMVLDRFASHIPLPTPVDDTHGSLGMGLGMGVGVGLGLGMDFDRREDRGPHMLGPKTPNGYDDISPITRDEWGFLLADGLKEEKTAPVETF